MKKKIIIPIIIVAVLIFGVLAVLCIKPPKDMSNIPSAMNFPYTTSDGFIEIQKLYNYSGYYVEDGSESEIDKVAAVKVKNVSGKTIEFLDMQLISGSDTLNFEISLLPPDATVLVMEADKKACSLTAKYEYGGGGCALIDELDLCPDKVQIYIDADGAITVENISDEPINELRLFYKNQLDTGEYVGGIAYTVSIKSLDSGESQKIRPTHFDPQCGRIMMVRIYE